MATYNLVQAVFDREAVSPDEDVAVCTMHIRQTVEAAPDILPVTDQGRDDFSQRWQAFMEAIRPHLSDKISLRELRYYDVAGAPGGLMGDPVHIEPMAMVGTSTGYFLPPQCAVSVTWKTAHRKRWGRFYLPGLTHVGITTHGRLHETAQGVIATAARGLADKSQTGAALTVFSRLHWNHEDPTTVQVDDIVDIIRRRRFSKANTRVVYPID